MTEGSKESSPIKPKVSGAGKTTKYITIIIFVIITVILVRGFFVSPEERNIRETLEPQMKVASNAAVHLNLDVPIEKEPAMPIVPEEVQPQQPPSILDRDKMQQTANAMQNEQGRLKAPTTVYGQEAKSAVGLASSPVGNGGGDSVFAQQVANAQVVTVKAKRDTNVDKKILQGKLIGAILESSINSDMPGMVRAVINKDVYSDTGRFVLLPRGTRLIGQYNSDVAVGQTRVMIMWTRAITPQHVDIALGSPSTDNLGQAGMGGSVDNHFWQIFGSSAMLSILGVAASNTSIGNASEVGVFGNPYQLAVSQGLLNSSNNVLQNRINIQPTIHVPQGSPIQVFVARDLDFSELTYYKGR